jgi:hypothetical protein
MIVKKEIERLYGQGFSMMEIAKKIGYSNSGVAYWMGKYKIPRRSRSEATYVKRNPDGDPFKIKQNLDRKEVLLKALGLGLYWGEGDKSDRNTQVRISNTDYRLILKFKDFLSRIYNLEEEKFKYSLVMFNDSDERKAIKFWTDRLKIKKHQLGQIVKISPQGKGTYKKKNQFGVLTVSVSNKKLKESILEEIKRV